ncbi:hypothetical protein FI667_g10793, partial [Globisporangium splendens]
MVQIAKLLIGSALATCALVDAHPGQPQHVKTTAEQAHHRMLMQSNQRALAACANSGYARELRDRTIARRLATVEQLRNEVAGRRRLAASTVLGKDHKSTSVTSTTADAATLLGTTPKCFLEPEVTQGPYYVSGLLRGLLALQRHGRVLGLVASGNGNSADLSNANATFLRGLAATNADGIVAFKTIFPGHYTSRTTHIHVLGSHDGTLQSNNTYTGGKVASVGQLFFDQSLITSVEATDVYKVNTQAITQNSADTIFGEEVVGDFDPVMNYALLGNSVTDGIFAWISTGVNRTVSKTVAAAATLTANGGVASSTTTTGGGAGGPPTGAPNGEPNSTTPTTTSTATPTTTPTPTPSATTSSVPAAVAGSVLASLMICLSALLLQ